MEILSGHQYVAVKVPEDKYAVFANTYYLGHVNLNDTENVIASKDVEKVAKESGTSILLNLTDLKNMQKATALGLMQELQYLIQNLK